MGLLYTVRMYVGLKGRTRYWRASETDGVFSWDLDCEQERENELQAEGCERQGTAGRLIKHAIKNQCTILFLFKFIYINA